MNTGEKIAFLRKIKGLTQEQIAEILEVSRQSVSRWEINVAFPETEKLLKLSRILGCSIDFLLNEKETDEVCLKPNFSPEEAYRLLKDCGYFFVATDSGGKPNQRPMGMLYCDGKKLYIGSDRRKRIYAEIMENPNISIASYSLSARRCVRVTGEAFEETSVDIHNAMKDFFPMLKQKYTADNDYFFVIIGVNISSIEIE